MCRLMSLYLLRRWLALAIGCAVVVGGFLARPGGSRHGPDRAVADLQAAVSRDGFIVRHAAGAGHRVVEVDPQGRERRGFPVERAGELRAVGTRAGTAIAWQDGRKLRLVRVEDHRDMGTWGKSVRQLCDGVASNDARFAVGWLESDDVVWIVHGPLAAQAGAAESEATEAVEAAEAIATGVPAGELARSEWCGVASAEHNVALLWRAGDRLSIVMCTAKRCGSLPGTFKLDHRLPILGFGCLRDACLIAARDAEGNAGLVYVTAAGRRKWNQRLPAASTVSIVGYGDRAFAVGYTTEAGAEVLRFDPSGASSPLWRDPYTTSVPALAWSSGRLLVAHRHADLAYDIVPAPR
ncbi:MAG TPA: hypothetical protein VFK02_28755 [Kofleriaceae bacterium]|nr:hypothetical protein [Kofleriaceae bacterium]